METMLPGSSQVARRFAVEVSELAPDGSAMNLGTMKVRGWQVIHECGAPPLALRVEDERSSVVHSGDTEWTPALVEAARGAGLLAVEAYTFDKQVRYHLDYTTLQAHASELDAVRTVLTHMSTSMLRRLTEVRLPAAYDAWSSRCEATIRSMFPAMTRPRSMAISLGKSGRPERQRRRRDRRWGRWFRLGGKDAYPSGHRCGGGHGERARNAGRVLNHVARTTLGIREATKGLQVVSAP
jgi:hypothetical protein